MKRQTTPATSKSTRWFPIASCGLSQLLLRRSCNACKACKAYRAECETGLPRRPFNPTAAARPDMPSHQAQRPWPSWHRHSEVLRHGGPRGLDGTAASGPECNKHRFHLSHAGPTRDLTVQAVRVPPDAKTDAAPGPSKAGAGSLGDNNSNINNTQGASSNARKAPNNYYSCVADGSNCDRCEYVLQSSASTIDKLLADCRAARLPMVRVLTDLEDHLMAYSKIISSTPSLRGETMHSVKHHLIWKHMLAALSKADAKISVAPLALLEAIAPQWSHALHNIPSWLTPRKLAGQVGCPVELLSMWVGLWQDALELPSAAGAVFRDTAGITAVLDKYMRDFGYPPSPYELMRKYKKMPDAYTATEVSDAEERSAKRRREAGGDAAPSTRSASGARLPRVSSPRRPGLPAAADAPPGQHHHTLGQSEAKSASKSARPVAFPASKKMTRPSLAAKQAGKTGDKARLIGRGPGARRPKHAALSQQSCVQLSGCRLAADKCHNVWMIKCPCLSALSFL